MMANVGKHLEKLFTKNLGVVQQGEREVLGDHFFAIQSLATQLQYFAKPEPQNMRMEHLSIESKRITVVRDDARVFHDV